MMYILGLPICDDSFMFNGYAATGLWIEIKSPVPETILNSDDAKHLTLALKHDKGIVINNQTEYDISLYAYGVLVPLADKSEDVFYISEDEFNEILPLLTETDNVGCCGFISEQEINGENCS